MASVFLKLAVSVIVLFVLYLVKKYSYWKRRGIPTVKGCIPLIGNILPVLTLQMNFHSMHTKMYEDNEKHSMVGYYKLWDPVLVIRDPQLAKTVLQSNFSSFHKNALEVREDLDPALSKNPFFCYGEQWSRARKRLTWAFSSVRLKTLFLTVAGVCKKFEDFLNRRLKENNRYEVELKYLFSKFTGEVIANAGLGIEGFCFEDKKHPMAFDAVSEEVFSSSWKRAIENNALFIRQLRNLLNQKFITAEFDAFFRNAIRENLKLREKDPTPRNDFLQLMMDLTKNSNETIDEDSLVAETMSFYVDGFETSSITLSFVGFQLARHPDIQEKLREEVKSKLAKYDGVLTFDGLKEMTYMDQVINESQRCHSGLGGLSKICTETIELEGSDGLKCRMEPGTEVVVAYQGLQNDPQYWSNPEVFDPDRFSEDRKQNIVKMTFLPFGEGPRMCVGMKMAQLQMKAALATLINNYKLELSPKTKLPLKMSPYYFLMAPVGGLWAYITKV
nr:PREDICTED: cytochrome P450 6j1-like [Megachile rotundata]